MRLAVRIVSTIVAGLVLGWLSSWMLLALLALVVPRPILDWLAVAGWAHYLASYLIIAVCMLLSVGAAWVVIGRALMWQPR